jgi:leader peptidase (prepilin peptidase)/N-methyltransferase
MNGDLVLAAIGGLFGLLFGSFLNVCISRWPAGGSVVRPPSRCPTCGAGIAWHDNIPVISWVRLRGKCRGCRRPISAMYPLVELATGLIWAWCVWRWGIGLEGLQWAAFGTILLGIAMTDAREFIIPHEFSFGGLALGVLLSFGAGLGGVVDALHGAIVGAGLVYLIGMLGEVAFKKEAMGGGDVAMMAMVGSFLGWQSVVATLFVGAAVGVVLHLGAQMVRRSDGRSDGQLDRRSDGQTDSWTDGQSVGPPLPPSDSSVRPSDRPTAQEMTPEELRTAGYLPFGVSLAIAAGIIALVTGPEPINRWFAWYAAMLGL